MTIWLKLFRLFRLHRTACDRQSNVAPAFRDGRMFVNLLLDATKRKYIKNMIFMLKAHLRPDDRPFSRSAQPAGVHPALSKTTRLTGGLWSNWRVTWWCRDYWPTHSREDLCVGLVDGEECQHGPVWLQRTARCTPVAERSDARLRSNRSQFWYEYDDVTDFTSCPDKTDRSISLH